MLTVFIVSVLLVTLFGFIELAYKSGGDWYDLDTVWETLIGNGTWGSNIIIKDINAPRVTIGIFIGMGLAVAGCAMQAVFRNPLASPYILGLSSGASVGAAFSMLFGIPFLPLVISTPLLAFITCFATMFLVYSMARVGGSVKTESLILSGVAVSALLSALVSFMTFIAGDKLEGIVFWSMGNLGNVLGENGWHEIEIMAPIVVVCCLLLIVQAKKLNAMMLGDIHAMDLGVDVAKTRLLVLILTTLIVASAVSFVGVIGFVGLVIPHILRMIAGPDNRVLLPLCMILGPVFVLFCDLVAHLVAEEYGVMPIGVVTALIGAPLFIFLLMKRKKEIGWN